MATKLIVLDTNVCLDLFVFNDPKSQAIWDEIQKKTIQAITNQACRLEWLRVLDYAQLSLDPDKKAHVIALFDQHISCIAPVIQSDIKLPLCKDTTDQKFLELARDGHAHTLISKDKALLKLATKTKRMGLFDISLPEKWCSI